MTSSNQSCCCNVNFLSFLHELLCLFYKNIDSHVQNYYISILSKIIRFQVVEIQLHSTKPELRFCAGSNPARVSEICDGEDLWQWSSLEIKLNAFRWSNILQKQLIIFIIIIIIVIIIIILIYFLLEFLKVGA